MMMGGGGGGEHTRDDGGGGTFPGVDCPPLPQVNIDLYSFRGRVSHSAASKF